MINWYKCTYSLRSFDKDEAYSYDIILEGESTESVRTRLLKAILAAWPVADGFTEHSIDNVEEMREKK